MSLIQILPRHKTIVLSLLKKYAINAFVFGSRAKQTAKEFSDLDLCLMENYERSTIRKLQDEFEESDLPYKVDVVVWSELDDGFKGRIQKDLLRFE